MCGIAFILLPSFWQVADETDLNKMLDKSYEGRSIGKLYGRYNDWVTSRGSSNANQELNYVHNQHQLSK